MVRATFFPRTMNYDGFFFIIFLGGSFELVKQLTLGAYKSCAFPLRITFLTSCLLDAKRLDCRLYKAFDRYKKSLSTFPFFTYGILPAIRTRILLAK